MSDRSGAGVQSREWSDPGPTGLDAPPPTRGTMKAPTPDELTLHLERELSAPRPYVFMMHADPDQLARWWGPNGFTVPRVPAMAIFHRATITPTKAELIAKWAPTRPVR